MCEDLEEVRKGVMKLPGGKAFQAKQTGHVNAPGVHLVCLRNSKEAGAAGEG